MDDHNVIELLNQATLGVNFTWKSLPSNLTNTQQRGSRTLRQELVDLQH